MPIGIAGTPAPGGELQRGHERGAARFAAPVALADDLALLVHRRDLQAVAARVEIDTAEVVLLSEIPGAVVHGVLRDDLEDVELIPGAGIVDVAGGFAVGRPEEHTSEIKSLMRNSYAVYSLNKKKRIFKH